MERVSKNLLVFVFFLAMLSVTGGPAVSHPHHDSLETDLMPYPFWSYPEDGDIYYVPTGTKLSFDGMMDMLAGGKLVYIGEAHNNVHSHRVQLDIIRDLYRRFPGRVAMGMEMFREPQQESIDRWTAGELSEAAFLKESKWLENWRMNYGYYRDIMNFARDNGIDILALNPPVELQRAYGMAAGKPLPPELARELPEIDSSDPYQKALVDAVYDAHKGGERMKEAFFRVQLLWEENMAERIVEYLGSPRGEGKIMVVIAGGAHVKYGFGVPKKVLRRMPASYYVVLPAMISMPEEVPEGEQLTMDVESPEIPLFAGDFIWAVPYELLDDREVRMGVELTPYGDVVAVHRVFEESPASLAGILPGDVIVSVDGLAVEEMNDVLLVVRSKRVGDSLEVVIRRKSRELHLSAHFTEPAG